MGDIDTLGASQMRAEEDGDDMFVLIAKEIAVRKCRLVQKKEKLKLLAHSLKKVNEEIKLAKEDNKKICQERKEVSHRQGTAVANLKRTQESRQSLETILCELNTKLSFERAETKRQSDEYKKALQKSDEIWESYEKKYTEFPMAKEVQAMKLKLKQVNFEKRETLMLIVDLKRQKKLKDEITEKLNHAKLVKLAELHFEYQNKLAEKHSLLNQKRKLEKLIENTKSKKNALSHTDATAIHRTNKSDFVKQTNAPQISMMFTMPEMQINSPPPMNNDVPTSGPSLFNWSALLGSSSSLSNYFRRNNQSQEKSKTVATPQIVSNVNAGKVFAKPQLKPSNKQDESVIPPTVKSTTDYGGLKRKSVVQSNDDKMGKESLMTRPLKKTNNLNTLFTKSVEELSAPQKPVVVKTNLIANITKTSIDKENNRTNNSSINLKKYMLNISNNTKSKTSNVSLKENTVSRNVTNMPTQKESEKSIEIQEKTSVESYLPVKKPSVVNQPNPDYEKNDQINLKEVQENVNYEGDMFANDNNDKQPENNTSLLMDPTSPPDIIPVENNSQPLSQGMNNSGRFLSQGSSDFNSPFDLNEKEKAIYQKLEAESPEFIYPKGTDMISSMTGEETSKPSIRSQYFPSKQPYSPAASLNTPPMDQDDYNSMPFSPINPGYVNSPPNATLGGFGFANSASHEMSLFGNTNKSDDGNQNNNGFSFNFGGGSTSKSSNIFNLFGGK